MYSTYWSQRLAGDQRARFRYPTPNGFVGNTQPTLGQEILQVPVTAWARL